MHAYNRFYFICLASLIFNNFIFGCSFKVIIPSYNNIRWYRMNLDSVIKQHYPPELFHIIYIDDASTDGTASAVKAFIEEKNIKNITLIQNSKNKGALQNIYEAVHDALDQDIIILVDGDDWLNDNEALSYLAEIYSTQDVWVTYGSFITKQSTKPRGEPIPSQIITTKKIRSYKWVSSHLRTFYAKLFKKIDISDLMAHETFFEAAWDLAIMFPLLEMAEERSLFIEKPLYFYNLHNPLSDFRKKRALQAQLETYIRSKNPYSRLENLF